MMIKWLFRWRNHDHVHSWEKKREWYDMYILKCEKCGKEKWKDSGY